MTRVAVILTLAAAPVLAVLGYVECSNGLQPPELEGGRTELEFADVDNDGNVDILSIGDHGSPYVGTDEHGVMVWFGDGHGNWSVFQYGDFGYGGIAVGDLNHDGNWDVGYGMHHNYSGEDLGDDMLEAALGDGTGRTWTAWDDGLMPGGSCWGMFSCDFADVDSDGDLDLGSISFGYGVGLRVFLNNGDGTWTESFRTPDSVNSSMEFYFRDVNRDGNADMIHAAAAPAVFFGDGTGGFVACDSGLPSGSRGLYGISPGDVDNDGGADVAFASQAGGVEVWAWNDAVRRWQSRSNGLPSSGGYEGTQLCDMDCDGFVDVCAFGGALLTVWTGDGAGNWTQATSVATPTPGYYEAMRAGADFDHNGRPDMAIVADEGTWPNDQNRAHAFRETTAARALGVFPVYPRGGEKLLNGSVQFIDWWSEAPGAESTRVALELSTTGRNGPWALVADNLPNAGRYQWRVPESVVSGDCYLRYTVSGPGGSVQTITPRAFVIGDTVVGIDASPRFRLERARIAPNPASGSARLILDARLDRPARVRLFDGVGREARAVAVPAGVEQTGLDLRGLAGGVYFCRLETVGAACTHRLIVQP